MGSKVNMEGVMLFEQPFARVRVPEHVSETISHPEA